MTEERKFEIEVLTRLTKIETMLEDFKGIEQKSTKAYELSIRNKEKIDKAEEKINEAYTISKSNKEKLDKTEDNNKWLFRTSIGAVIVGLIGIILSLISFK